MWRRPRGPNARSARVWSQRNRALLLSFIGGGFECSTHRRHDRVRVDTVADTRHDAVASQDYALLAEHGLLTARDGLRWHLIDRGGAYDWSSWLPQLRAAREAGVQVIWDLMHWGYPDDLDFHNPAFVERFAAFARAAARVHATETGDAPHWVAVNEMSFWAWIGGDGGTWAPYGGGGWAVKSQAVRAALAATAEVRAVDSRARMVTSEPLIQIHPPEDAGQPQIDEAWWANNAQLEATDMLLGRANPELGGHEGAVDLIGCNYYTNNQWELHGRTVPAGLPHYRPLRGLLAQAHARYGRPLYISETGCEGSFRPSWLHYVAAEVAAAIEAGTPVEGICLYPVLDHPGWDDGRHCPNGLFDGVGDRAAEPSFLAEVHTQQMRFARLTRPA